MNQKEALEQFVIDEVLINPITKIVDNLKAGNYRDCDIKWLDTKLEKFMKLTAETLGIDGLVGSQVGQGNFTVLNDYNKSKYIQWFETLLNYFKSF